MTTTLERTRILKNTDVCDRCNAKAFVSASGVGGVLMFCGHHFFIHKNKIFDWANDIIDETNFIE